MALQCLKTLRLWLVGCQKLGLWALALWLLGWHVLSAQAADFSGPVGFESRWFSDRGEGQQSISLTPKWQWGKGSNDFTLELFARVDSEDNERSHVDVREATWLHMADDWDVKVGVGRVFWGVTETQHLVDVINQTDAVEAIDGEDKLGQPMVQWSKIADWGILDVFVLPYFRERTFAGRDGFLSGSLPVDQDRVLYESSAKQRHVDVALRYSRTLGDWDYGLSYFRGTNRDPKLLPSINDSGNRVLQPYYDQMQQVGVDVQATKGAWLWKLEAIAREDSQYDYAATTLGFEHTFYGIAASAIDWGVLLEFSRDSRGANAPTPNQKDIAFAHRLTWNDVNSTELLLGVTQDLDDSDSYSAFIEASRRIGARWKVSADAWLLQSDDPQDPSWLLRNDDFVQIGVDYYF